MNKLLLVFILLATQSGFGQSPKNSLSTSLFRYENNSQAIYGKLNGKFLSGIEYQRILNRWSFGLKYEHGLNKIEERCEGCFDASQGTAYIKEDNIYLSGYYSFPKLFQANLEFYSGLSVYYSHLNYSGAFIGGWNGSHDRNSTYNTLGICPSIGFKYFPLTQLFIAINSSYRVGKSEVKDQIRNSKTKGGESILNIAELRVGVRF